jgi:hypothetical protein
MTRSRAGNLAGLPVNISCSLVTAITPTHTLSQAKKGNPCFTFLMAGLVWRLNPQLICARICLHRVRKWKKQERIMQKRGSGRFGKYGDLKRKEKIRQTRVLKRDDKAKASAQWAVVNGQKRDHLLKLNTDGVVGERPRPDQKPNGEAENS